MQASVRHLSVIIWLYKTLYTLLVPHLNSFFFSSFVFNVFFNSLSFAVVAKLSIWRN